MLCPNCKYPDNRVLDTRAQKEGEIRRRRECLKCKERFTTVETIVLQYPHVIKRDKSTEAFDEEKLRRGIQLACMKRPVSLSQIENIVRRVSRCILELNEKEVGSDFIGQAVVRELRDVDNVAYVRFASVYRTFKDIEEFVQALKGDDGVRPTTIP